MSDGTGKESPVELVGQDGQVYNAKRMGKISLRIMEPWIRSRAKRHYLAEARNDADVSPAELAEIIAAIEMRSITNREMFEAWSSIPGMLYILQQALLPFNPGMTIDRIEGLFGEILPETMNRLYEQSGFDPEFLGKERTPEGTDPTTTPSTTGTG